MVEAYPDLKAQVLADEDPLGRRCDVRSINVFANEIQSTHSIRQDLQKLGLRSDMADLEFRHDDRTDFEKRLKTSKNLVFVHDTAPEVAADLVLIDQLRQKNTQLQILLSRQELSTGSSRCGDLSRTPGLWRLWGVFFPSTGLGFCG